MFSLTSDIVIHIDLLHAFPHFGEAVMLVTTVTDEQLQKAKAFMERRGENVRQWLIAGGLPITPLITIVKRPRQTLDPFDTMASVAYKFYIAGYGMDEVEDVPPVDPPLLPYDPEGI